MRPGVSGGTLGDAIAKAEVVPGQDVIRSFAAPLKKEGAMAILHGNLAPAGRGDQAIGGIPEPHASIPGARWCSSLLRT